MRNTESNSSGGDKRQEVVNVFANSLIPGSSGLRQQKLDLSAVNLPAAIQTIISALLSLFGLLRTYGAN